MPDVSLTKSAPRLRWWQLIVWITVLGLLGLVALQMRRSGPLAAGPVGVGEKAPDFSLTTFDGQTYRLSELRGGTSPSGGQVVVINFWASWCKPCEQEAADLESAWREYKDRGVVFLGVDYVDTETEALVYLRRFNITYPNGPDVGTRISQAYRIKGVPETYFVDRRGTLAHVKIGPTSQAELRDVIESVLK